MNGYRLTDPDIHDSFEHHSKGTLNSLKSEIVLLRALLEDRLNLCETPAERMSAFPVITNALGTLSKMIDTLQKVEIQSNRLLSVDQVEAFVDKIVAIVASELPSDPVLIDRIVTKIGEIDLA